MFDKNGDPSDKCIEASKIEKYLTGIARIIYYKKYATNENYFLTDIIEGELVKGVVDGYARCIEIRNNKCKMSKVIISCKVGFWKQKDGHLMPHGKWCWFITNSHGETKIKAPDGIYSGHLDNRNRQVLHKYHSAAINDFCRNKPPGVQSKKVKVSMIARLLDQVFKKEAPNKELLYLDVYN